MPALADEDVELTEPQRVILHRYAEAFRFGFTSVEARLYAESEIDCGELRRLTDAGCPPALAARILF